MLFWAKKGAVYSLGASITRIFRFIFFFHKKLTGGIMFFFGYLPEIRHQSSKIITKPHSFPTNFIDFFLKLCYTFS